MNLCRPRTILVSLTLCLGLGATHPAFAKLEELEYNSALAYLDDMDRYLDDVYYPAQKVGKDFHDRCEAARKALKEAEDLNAAYAAIADAVKSVDPRIMLVPPVRSARCDYGWDWRIYGDAAYVVQLDKEGDARSQGLKLGDKVLEIEGNPLNRETNQIMTEVFKTIAPRRELRVAVQSPGDAQPRLIAIASTLRPQRRLHKVGAWTEPILTDKEKQHLDDFKTVAKHVHRVGTVAIWNTQDLDRTTGDVAEALKLTADATALVIDLRGRRVLRYETAMRLLDGLFTDDFTVGKRGHEDLTSTLKVSGSKDAYKGTVVVLIDARTSFYGEVIARVLQQKQRAVVMGDRTAGRVFELRIYSDNHRSTKHNYELSGVAVPIGEITLADGSSLDGKGVAPDWQVLPTGADLAAERDVVLAKALKMLKQNISPEDAYKLLWVDYDDDEDAEN